MPLFVPAIEVACREKCHDLDELFSLSNAQFNSECQETVDRINGGQDLYPPHGKHDAPLWPRFTAMKRVYRIYFIGCS